MVKLINKEELYRKNLFSLVSKLEAQRYSFYDKELQEKYSALKLQMEEIVIQDKTKKSEIPLGKFASRERDEQAILDQIEENINSIAFKNLEQRLQNSYDSLPWYAVFNKISVKKAINLVNKNKNYASYYKIVVDILNKGQNEKN